MLIHANVTGSPPPRGDRGPGKYKNSSGILRRFLINLSSYFTNGK